MHSHGTPTKTGEAMLAADINNVTVLLSVCQSILLNPGQFIQVPFSHLLPPHYHLTLDLIFLLISALEILSLISVPTILPPSGCT